MIQNTPTPTPGFPIRTKLQVCILLTINVSPKDWQSLLIEVPGVVDAVALEHLGYQCFRVDYNQVLLKEIKVLSTEENTPGHVKFTPL